jgi:hypothetical protein
MYVCMYVCMHVCMHACMHTCIYRPTHVHIQKFLSKPFIAERQSPGGTAKNHETHLCPACVVPHSYTMTQPRGPGHENLRSFKFKRRSNNVASHIQQNDKKEE